MSTLSLLMSELVSHLQSDSTLTGLTDSITTDAGYDKVPRGIRIHVRPVDNNANESNTLGGRMRDVVVGFVLVGRNINQSASDTAVEEVIEALDNATRTFLSQTDITNRRVAFICERDMADDYPEMRIEYASVSYKIATV